MVLKALDLFCGAGGASMGLHRAGFEVVGVDFKRQPNYPFEFHRLDWFSGLQMLRNDIDFIWASPPCQRYIRSGLVRDQKDRPDLVGPVREALEDCGVPFVIENVPGAPLRKDLVLCGSHFGLSVRRHRVFECSDFVPPAQPKCDHSKPVVGVYGNPHGKRGAWPGMLPGTIETWREAMQIDWMTAKEMSQAIPPAYSEYIAKQILSAHGACSRD